MKIRRWQICPYHLLGGTIKEKHHITQFGDFLHNPETSAYRSFQVSRSKCMGIIAFAKYSSKSVKMCALVTDRWHKLHACSRWLQLLIIQSIQQDLHNALGFRSLISAQCECWYWHMPAFQCAFSHCFATKVTATPIVASFIPSSPLHLSHCFGDSSLFMRHISQVRRLVKPPWSRVMSGWSGVEICYLPLTARVSFAVSISRM